MPRPLIVAPSILSADFARLGEEMPRGRCRRRRLDPRRRDGRPLRAQHHHRAAGREGAAAAHKKPFDVHLMIAPCDPISRPSPRPAPTSSPCTWRPVRTCTARCRRSARSARRPAWRSTPARRWRRSSRDRPGRPGAGDVGQPRLRRAGVHPLRAREDLAAARAGRRPPDRHRGRRRHHAGERGASRAGRRQCAGRRLRGVQGRRRGRYRANIAAIRNAAALARGASDGRPGRRRLARRRILQEPGPAASSGARTAASATASRPTARPGSRPRPGAIISTSRMAAPGRTARCSIGRSRSSKARSRSPMRSRDCGSKAGPSRTIPPSRTARPTASTAFTICMRPIPPPIRATPAK